MLGFLLAFGLIGLLVALVHRQPNRFSITRTATMNACPKEIFAQINNLHRWEAWSPWAKLDPDAVNRYEGPEEGLGASLAWSGSRKVGVGKMTIIESAAPELVCLRLDFEKPMRATNTATFTLKADGAHTSVTWNMSGTSNFVGKLMNAFMNCEQMVGGQFEEGLASLRTIVEQSSGHQEAAA